MSPFRASAPLTGRWEHFSLDIADGVATLTFSRPDKLNALTFEAYADLRDLVAELPHRGDARVLVITGHGRGFCSGGDVEEIIGALQRMEAAELLEFTRMTGSVVKGLRDCPLPVIAAVNGIAAGAGSVIALAADFRLLARSARFAFLFTSVGLSGADMGSAYLLPRLVGLGRATELLMLGDKVDAERALAIGLATEVVDDDALPAAAASLAGRLASGPALAYSQTKLLLAREQDMDLAGAIEMEALVQALLMKSHDHGEFYRAWSDGRKPEWAGR
jgi:enoyl-CoA hydratase/carnithine racemase